MSTWPINKFMWVYTQPFDRNSFVCLGTGFWGKFFLTMLKKCGVDSVYTILEIPKPSPDRKTFLDESSEMCREGIFFDTTALKVDMKQTIEDNPKLNAIQVLEKVLPGVQFNYNQYMRSMRYKPTNNIHHFNGVYSVLGYMGLPRAVKRKTITNKSVFAEIGSEITHHNVFVPNWANSMGSVQTTSNAGPSRTPMEESGVFGIDFPELECEVWDDIVNDIDDIPEAELSHELMEELKDLEDRNPHYVDEILWTLNEYRGTKNELDNEFRNAVKEFSDLKDLLAFFESICTWRPFDLWILLAILKVDALEPRTKDKIVKLVPAAKFEFV